MTTGAREFFRDALQDEMRKMFLNESELSEAISELNSNPDYRRDFLSSLLAYERGMNK